MYGHSKKNKEMIWHPGTSNREKSFPPIRTKRTGGRNGVIRVITENWNCKGVFSWWERGIQSLLGDRVLTKEGKGDKYTTYPFTFVS